MRPKVSLLPNEVSALVHHVELHRAGWWDKAVQRLVFAAIWLSGASANLEEVKRTLKEVFQLSLNSGKLSSVLNDLALQDSIVELPNGSFHIPDEKRKMFEQDITTTEKVEKDAQDFFFKLVKELDINLNEKLVWATFESEFLAPLIKEVGANAYHLISGDHMIVDKNLVGRFLSKFPSDFHIKLRKLIVTFLDPKNNDVRSYISRMLHARFCIEASGLPADVIQKLNSTVGEDIQFQVFVDTNFLFSLLKLHENPSNDVASELQELISQLKSNPKIELFITSKTIEEAKTSILSAQYQVTGIPSGNNFTKSALHVLSGMAVKFLSERLRRRGNLDPESWFGPYLHNFVPIAQGLGIEFFNEKMDDYSTRQDVVDDILSVIKAEERLPEPKRKSYEKVAHDMALWHFVNDKRPAYVESPIDAHCWILTLDARLIAFDEQKLNNVNSKVPLCLHPTSFIQLLQFWIPRSQEFEEAIIGSLRLPFLFQEFDVDAEKISLKILRGLGRFEGGNDIPEKVITGVILNEGLRSRLKQENSADEELSLIRDALFEEIKLKANSEKLAKDTEIENLQKQINEKESQTKALNEKISIQENDIKDLNLKWKQKEEIDEKNSTYTVYYIYLFFIILFSSILAFFVGSILKELNLYIGLWQTRGLALILFLILGHLLLENSNKHKKIGKLWLFTKVRKFRIWLWGFIFITLVGGTTCSLWANQIQNKIDHQSELQKK